MYLLKLLTNPIEAIIFIAAIVLAVSIHEYSHAASAVWFGDDTPKLMGRTTLNPAAHIDPLGALFFLIAGFGWGKPVIINPIRLPKRVFELYVALAGPMSNLLFALAINIFLLLSQSFLPLSLVNALGILVMVNLALATFNILPVPPLDGSSILAHFFPAYRSVIGSQIGFLILIFLLFMPGPGGSLLQSILTPIYSFFSTITLSSLVI